MLFGLGFMILLLSTCVVSESVLVPFVMAIIGIGLMLVSKRRENEHNGNDGR